MKYWDEKFYWTYQHGVSWPDDYIGPDSMTWWIIEKSVIFTDIGLLRISESVRAYTYLNLSSQASARSSIVGNKILISDGNFSLGKNDEVNETPKITHQSTITHHELEKKPNITQAQKPTITHHELAKEPTHEDEKIVLVLALAGGFAIWNVFQ